MFRGKDIEGVVRTFKKKQIPLFHACQLLDFDSYLQLGGIPSRACLEESHLHFTKFRTDTQDKVHGVWDKVFVNLQDFGEIFATGKKGVPNPYGPILLQFSPDALLEATDVSITLRSAGAEDFDREKESLTMLEEVERLFFKEYGPDRYLIRFGNRLKEEFREKRKVKSVEINCTVPSGRLPFDYVERVIVDHYTTTQGSQLLNLVLNQCFYRGHDYMKGSIYFRNARSDRKQLYYELANFIMSNNELSLQSLLNAQRISPFMKEWAASIRGSEPEFQFDRYAEYLKQGTLNYVYDK